jgi:hypothetical protein
MRFARWTFVVAGVWGLLSVTPLYWLEGVISRERPPAITHPEYFYGFIGVTVAWQVLFLTIATDPIRYRPAMPAAVLEKAAFAVGVPILFAMHRVAADSVVFSGIDGLLGIGFIVSYLRTPRL